MNRVKKLCKTTESYGLLCHILNSLLLECRRSSLFYIIYVLTF